MPELSRAQLAAYAIALGLIAWLGTRYLTHATGSEPSGSGSAGATAGPRPPSANAPDGAGAGVSVEAAADGPATVHVAGAVRRPGVYRLKAGARVQAAVRAAGGATRQADLDGLNLAGEVKDGRQVLVPRRGGTTGSPGGAQPGGEPAAAGGAAGADAPPIDLNLATAEQLDTLDGVGPATVQKILAYREEHGGFASVEELGQVSGIGEKRLAALRERLRV